MSNFYNKWRDHSHPQLPKYIYMQLHMPRVRVEVGDVQYGDNLPTIYLLKVNIFYQCSIAIL